MLRRIFLFLLVIIGSSCYYTPDNFNADIVIDNRGVFELSYSGDLVRVGFLKEYQDGIVTPENIGEKIDTIERDLRRDPAFTQISSKGQGRFAVKYKRNGVIHSESIITFIRRDSEIFKITSSRESPVYEVTFRGKYIGPEKQKQLFDLGVHVRGKFRLLTNAEVIRHNAPTVIENPPGFGGGTVYEWDFDDFKGVTLENGILTGIPSLILKLSEKR